MKNKGTVLRSTFIPATAIMLTISLSGCVSLFRGFDLNNSESILVDPNERAITVTTIKRTSRPGQVDPRYIVCSEPNSDVAIAVSKSIEAALNVKGQGEGSFSQTSAQAAIQLAERTSAIQVLRDRMHHTCQDFANGAVSSATYSVEISRLNDAMVSLVLGESAAGSYGRAGAAAGGEASGSVQTTSEDYQLTLNQLFEEEKQANEVVADKQENVDTAEQLAKSTEALAEADSESEAKVVAAEEAKETLDDSEVELQVAEQEQDRIKEEIRRTTTQALTSSSKFTTVSGHGGLTTKADSSIASIMADMQDRFIDRSAAKDFVTSCIAELARITFKPSDTQKTKPEHKYIPRDSDFYKTRLAQAEELYLNEPDNDDLRRIAENAYDDFSVFLSEDRISDLSSLCRANLDEIIFKEQANLKVLNAQKLGAKVAIQNSKVVELSKTLEAQSACIKLSGDKQTVCLNTIAKAVDKTLNVAPLAPKVTPKPPVKLAKFILPGDAFDKFNKITEAVSVRYNTLKTKVLKGVTSHVDFSKLTGDAKIKAIQENTQRAKARAERTTLLPRVVAYKVENPTLTAAISLRDVLASRDTDQSEIDGPKELQSQWRQMIGMLAEEEVRVKPSKPGIEKLKARISINQIDSKILEEKISEVIGKLTGIDDAAKKVLKESDKFESDHKAILK